MIRVVLVLATILSCCWGISISNSSQQQQHQQQQPQSKQLGNSRFPVISCSNGHVIAHPTDCSSFIKCGFNDLDNIILQCSFPNLYNIQTQRCDLPSRVACRMFTWMARPFVPRNEIIPKRNFLD